MKLLNKKGDCLMMPETKEKKSPREIDYIRDPIACLYWRLLPSAIGSLLTASVASLIDVVILSYFLGPDMLAVVGLCMPVYMLVNTLGMLIASGAATLYAQYLGEGNKEEALRYFSISVAHTLLCGGALTLGGCSSPGRWCDCWEPTRLCSSPRWNMPTYCFSS